MGASLSSDVYQYKVDGHLEEIDHCVVIMDDIIIYGFDNDGTDHDRTVRQVMKKAQEVGMCFNPTVSVQKEQSEILWHDANKAGHGPWPCKNRSIEKIAQTKVRKFTSKFPWDSEIFSKVWSKNHRSYAQPEKPVKKGQWNHMDQYPHNWF